MATDPFYALPANEGVEGTTGHGNITQDVEVLDNYIFDEVQNGAEANRGSLYVQLLNRTAMPYSYESIVFVNATSQSSAAAWGAVVHRAYLADFLSATNTGFDSRSLNVTFVDHPFPLTAQLESITKAAAGTTSAIIMGIAWLMISDSLIQNIIREKQRNIKHQIMVSGSSLSAYWLGHYLGDIVF